MPKKTWIKVKRGLLQPPHRTTLGIRIWLYLYMIDITDWETGTILEWRDKNAADELEMPLDTIRKQRRQLEEDGYIKSTQDQHSQKITLLKWIDPRKYSGEVLNESGQNRPPTDLPTEQPVPPHTGVSKTHHPDCSESQGCHQGCHQSGHQGIEQLATLPIKPHTTDHIPKNKEVLTTEKVIERGERILEDLGYKNRDAFIFNTPSLTEDQRLDNLTGKYPEDVRLFIKELCKHWGLIPPSMDDVSGFEYWIESGRRLVTVCAEFGHDIIEKVYDDQVRRINKGGARLMISTPDSLVNPCRSKAGELRKTKQGLTPDERVSAYEDRARKRREKSSRG